MYSLLFVVAIATLAAIYFREQSLKKPKEPERFEPTDIGDMSPEKGDMLVCTESYGEFTEGYNYIVRVEYGGALVVWNDEGDNVLAAGLDPRKFRVIEKNVDGTASMRVKDGEDV